MIESTTTFLSFDVEAVAPFFAGILDKEMARIDRAMFVSGFCCSM